MSRPALQLAASPFPRTDAVLERIIPEGWAPGAVAAIWNFHDSRALPWIRTIGSRRLHPSVQPLAENTVFDLASLTKPLVTATLMARLVERRLLEWSTPVCALLPDAPPEWASIEVWHLLSHTAGFQAWSPFWQKLREEYGDQLPAVSIAKRQRSMRREVLLQMPETPAGFRTLYSDVSFLVLGFMVEQVTGLPLDHAWRELGFDASFRTVHRKPSFQQPADDQAAATEASDWRGGVMQGEVHDENCWSMGGIAGHAGLFGSASSVIEIVNSIFRGALFSEDSAEALFARVTPKQGDPRTLGWDIPSGESSSAGRILAKRRGVVGHLGFTGTSLWVDRRTGWSFLLLTQRVHLGRENTGIRTLRPLFHDAAAADLGIDRLSDFERP